MTGRRRRTTSEQNWSGQGRDRPAPGRSRRRTNLPVPLRRGRQPTVPIGRESQRCGRVDPDPRTPSPAHSTMFTRTEILARFRAQVAAGKPIIGGGAGTGISAKCAEAGGIDLIIIYNSGRFRMAGRGQLAGMMPYGDANQIVMDMAREVLPVVENTPVLAGVCGTDPFRVMKRFLRDVQRRRLQRRAELPHRRPDRRHLPRRASKRPAWASARKST